MQKGAAFVRQPGVAQTEVLTLIERFTVPENREPRAFDPELLLRLGCQQGPQASGVFRVFERLPGLPPLPERTAAVWRIPETLRPTHRNIMLVAGFEHAYVAWDVLGAFLRAERECPRFLVDGAVGMYIQLPNRAVMAVHASLFRDAFFLDNPVIPRNHLLQAKFPPGTRYVVTGRPPEA